MRTLAPQVLGVLGRRSGDFAAAEDAVQEALVVAVTHWPRDGVPEKPFGWLLQTATRRLLDAVRSDRARRGREERWAAEDAVTPDAPGDDDSLTVLFLCCHPALTPSSAIPLTLRAVGGLTTAEIARAFLVPEATMAQRISRAKRRVAEAGSTFTMPAPDERAARLRSVLHVLYVMFTEGSTSTSGGDLHRVDVSDEAVRLTRWLHALEPADPEVTGLLALMLLTDARRPARTDAAGELVPLPEQDRTRWDRALVAEGLALLDEAIAARSVGEYQLQAAVAAVHDRAATAADTDWPQIVTLYGLLERMTGSPVVAVNRAVAVAMVDGPEAGLHLLDDVDLPGHRLDAVRAHLLESAGDIAAARTAYRRAAAAATSVPERRYLTLRAARLTPSA
ncbi:RNA polymerase sigma factor [Cellulomonas fimi]|uniref:RNA polymerase sigma factor n=1 Tax=Cellulomonas fimi TaxID=1708 RepID=UPI00403FD44D